MRDSPKGNLLKDHHILEINLISAQGLKPPSKSTRRMQTYALAWVDPSAKLRTQLDKISGENPTWNDKFLFRVTSEFLASETSGISVEIYNVGMLRDSLIGTVRFLISSLLPSLAATPASPSPRSVAAAPMMPFFTAFQIRRPSGSFHGVLNVGAMVVNNPEFTAAMTDVSAIGYRDLMGGRRGRRNDGGGMRKVKSMEFHMAGLTDENDGNLSDGSELTTSSLTSSPTPPLKSWNRVRDLAGTNNSNGHVRSSSDGGGMLSFLMNKKKPVRSESQNNLSGLSGSHSPSH
ncbi:hypothetical protein ACFE04_018188 [Oxalis oulophora]